MKKIIFLVGCVFFIYLSQKASDRFFLISELDNSKYIKQKFRCYASLEDVCNNSDIIVLYTAPRKGDTPFYLTSEKNLNNFIYDTSKLFLAVQQGEEKVVKLLLKNGADKNIVDCYNRLPLYYASKNNNKKIITLLKNNYCLPYSQNMQYIE